MGNIARKDPALGFMNKEQWAEIYDIARNNGVEVHRLITVLTATNLNMTEQEVYAAVKEWAIERSIS